jgi:ABC-2 type transport system permease protein
MRWLPIFKKEMRLYFGSPVAYAFLALFLLITGWMFAQIFLIYSELSMRAFMQPMAAQNLNPTENVMRAALLQHERGAAVLHAHAHHAALRRGEEIRHHRAAADLSRARRRGAGGASSWPRARYTVSCSSSPSPIRASWPPSGASSGGAILTGYLGLLLLGSAFLAVGVFISSLTENQIVAGSATFGALLGFWLIGWGADAAGGWVRTVLQYLSIIEHMDSFGKGVIDTKDVVYYVTVTAFALFLTLRALDAKRWRGVDR